jgi:hypothetical protein
MGKRLCTKGMALAVPQEAARMRALAPEVRFSRHLGILSRLNAPQLDGHAPRDLNPLAVDPAVVVKKQRRNHGADAMKVRPTSAASILGCFGMSPGRDIASLTDSIVEDNTKIWRYRQGNQPHLADD